MKITSVPKHRQEQIREALSYMPMTGQELARELILSYETTICYLKLLREAKPKKAFISVWRGKGRNCTAVYSWGDSPDADKRWSQVDDAAAECRVEIPQPHYLQSWLFVARDEGRLAA